LISQVAGKDDDFDSIPNLDVVIAEGMLTDCGGERAL
jgi:hypothetical protein